MGYGQNGFMCQVHYPELLKIIKDYEAQQQVKVEPEVKVNFAEIEKELNNYAEEKNGRIMDNADACDHLQSKLNYINDNFYLIRK